MPIVKIEITASTVAWYGAIIASVALGIELVKLWLERHSVKLEILPRMRCTAPIFGQPKDTDFVMFRIINRGKRPVTITHHCVRLKRRNGKVRDLYIAPNFYGPAPTVGSLPKEILDGQSHELFAELEDLMGLTEQFENIDCFYIFDATGKMWKKRMTRRLLREFRDAIQSTRSGK